jgi:hypothetical protein
MSRLATPSTARMKLFVDGTQTVAVDVGVMLRGADIGMSE